MATTQQPDTAAWITGIVTNLVEESPANNLREEAIKNRGAPADRLRSG